MLLVNFVRKTERQFHPLVDIEPDLAIETEVMVDGLNVPGQV